MDVKFLDTYVLIEISKGNQKFLKYLNEQFVISDLILIEFYNVLLREQNEELAEYWYKKFEFFALPVTRETLKKAVKYRVANKNKNLSFFDCVGYIFAVENNMKFVTGDKEFQNKDGVEFLK